MRKKNLRVSNNNSLEKLQCDTNQLISLNVDNNLSCLGFDHISYPLTPHVEIEEVYYLKL